ncbi:hypothetical protein [Cecembia rubra]|uniref:hypothetical protein n=1 Tax=Cecembia rubra TaxID=1485585 RepID=UPI000D0D2AC0|nr:hypothetical protein [Cecembia rubra]
MMVLISVRLNRQKFNKLQDFLVLLKKKNISGNLQACAIQVFHDAVDLIYPFEIHDKHQT